MALVGVLILVDHYVLESAVIEVQNIVVLLEQLDGIAYKIVKIHGVRGHHTTLVQLVRFGYVFQAAVIIRGYLDVFGLFHLILVL